MLSKACSFTLTSSHPLELFFLCWGSRRSESPLFPQGTRGCEAAGSAPQPHLEDKDGASILMSPEPKQSASRKREEQVKWGRESQETGWQVA